MRASQSQHYQASAPHFPEVVRGHTGADRLTQSLALDVHGPEVDAAHTRAPRTSFTGVRVAGEVAGRAEASL
ncbi:hypothetical protein Ait01nite_074620 [Actinoplanes italicus]|nr:hypothetical protein Ait01nite_074620 [Actinoplanes italicus]